MEEYSLVYVRPIGINSEGFFEYEFFFSYTPDVVWGQDWNEQCPSACDDMDPDPTTYSEVKRLRTEIPLTCAQNNSCFSMQDVIDGVLACAWEDISEYETYPEPYRLILKFGESYENVKKTLFNRGCIFEEDSIEL